LIVSIRCLRARSTPRIRQNQLIVQVHQIRYTRKRHRPIRQIRGHFLHRARQDRRVTLLDNNTPPVPDTPRQIIIRNSHSKRALIGVTQHHRAIQRHHLAAPHTVRINSPHCKHQTPSRCRSRYTSRTRVSSVAPTIETWMLFTPGLRSNRRDRSETSSQRSGVMRPAAASISRVSPSRISPSISMRSEPRMMRKSVPGPRTSHTGETGPSPPTSTVHEPCTTDSAKITGKNGVVFSESHMTDSGPSAPPTHLQPSESPSKYGSSSGGSTSTIARRSSRSEEHTSELQSRFDL